MVLKSIVPKVLRSIVSNTEDETSGEIQKDIIGCECSVFPTDFSANSIIIRVAKSNSGKKRHILTSDVMSVSTTELEVRVETKKSIYIFTR